MNKFGKDDILGNIFEMSELKDKGFNFDAFDYEAKIVCDVGGWSMENTAKVMNDMVVVPLEKMNKVLVFDINKNPHLRLVKIDLKTEGQLTGKEEELKTEIEIKSKGKIFGQTFNTFELIEALKDPKLTDDNAPITIYTKNFSALLKIIYECGSCDKLHLIGCEDGDELFDSDFIKGKIHINHSYKKGKYITKKELLNLLESIPKIMNITIETYNDEHPYTLTSVYKCPSCPAIHLDAAYDDFNHHIN